MTTSEFETALRARGIETTVDADDGLVMLLLSESEYRKGKKYDKIVSEIGWRRSWGRRVKRG